MRGIYIHIPFCIQKCRYCGFCSYEGQEALMEEYTRALTGEICGTKEEQGATLYIGGGTPTLLPTEYLTKIIYKARERFNISGDAEITVEANPKTITPQKLSALRAAGVNRISLGVQSLDDGELLALGRAHSARDGHDAMRMIRRAGFENFSADIMFALPGQDIKTLKSTIEGVMEYAPTHISAYSLSIDEGTYFEKHPPKNLPDEECEREMYYTLRDTLKAAGYEHYEISNFAKEGHRAVHNTLYWQGQEYIGLGAAAHSYFGGVRYSSPTSLTEYIKNPLKKVGHEVIGEAEKQKEYYMLGLRMLSGVPERYHENIERLIKCGLLHRREGGLIALTERGVDISNYVMSELM